MHIHNSEEQQERDRKRIECKPFKGYPNRWADPVFQEYIFGYDADAVVLEAWSKYKAAKEQGKGKKIEEVV